MITMVVLRVSACICSMHVGVTDSIAADVSVWMFVVGCLFGSLLLVVCLDGFYWRVCPCLLLVALAFGWLVHRRQSIVSWLIGWLVN